MRNTFMLYNVGMVQAICFFNRLNNEMCIRRQHEYFYFIAGASGIGPDITPALLDKMTVSKSLKKLADLGYVHRIEHETDTRAKVVSMTASGKRMVRTLVPIVEKIDSNFFGQVTDTEQKTLLRIFRKFTSGNQDA